MPDVRELLVVDAGSTGGTEAISRAVEIELRRAIFREVRGDRFRYF